LPLDDLRAVNIDPALTTFKFQLTIKPRASKHGHLVLEFPFSETYFYQANSKHPDRDRVVVPVQLLSLALASARGYLAALSGDFSSFDRKSNKIKALLKGVNRSIAEETNPDAKLALTNEKKSLELQLEALPIERSQLEATSKTITNILSFTGEKELNLNNEIQAKQNALILKISFGKIVPYLKDVQLGGIKVSHSKKDGAGEDYLVINVKAQLEEPVTPSEKVAHTQQNNLNVAPSLLVRLNEALFNSKLIAGMEKEKMPSDIRDFDVAFKEDGVHVSGKYHKFFFNIPFDSIVDFVTTGPDVFEVRLRKLDVEGINFKFFTRYALDAVKEKLDKTLKGICSFTYLGDKDDSKVLQVQVDPKSLVPAFPNLHLVDVDVRNRAFLLKIGHIEQEKL